MYKVDEIESWSDFSRTTARRHGSLPGKLFSLYRYIISVSKSAETADVVGRPTQSASKMGVGTTGLFLCCNGIHILYVLNRRDWESVRFQLNRRAATRRATRHVVLSIYRYSRSISG